MYVCQTSRLNVLFTSLKMNSLILDAVVPSTSMDENCADVSTKSPPASVHRSRLQLRRTVHIEARQIVDFNEILMSRVPLYHPKSDASIELQKCRETRLRQSQSQGPAVDVV